MIKLKEGQKVLSEDGNLYEIEKGDLIESKLQEGRDTIDILLAELTDENDHSGAAVIEAVYYGDLKKAEVAFARWVKREKQGYL